MEKLLQLLILSFAMCILAHFPAAHAKAICPLKVVVVNSQNQDVDALIKVVEQNGRIHEADNAMGGVWFCDLGILQVRVEVGTKATCYQNVVNNVWLFEEEMITLKVIHDTAKCDPGLFLPETRPCKVMMRFRDDDDKPVPNVRVNIDTMGSRISDEYGRVYLRFSHSHVLTAAVDDERFRGNTLRYTCPLGSSREELEIVLEENIRR